LNITRASTNKIFIASIPCSICISLGKSDNCTVATSMTPTTTHQQQAEMSSNSSNKATTTTPAKRGYKSHVPSACNVTIIIAITLFYI
jgi:hypothetical protein